MSVTSPLADRGQTPAGRVVRALPLLPGKRGALAGFIAELAARQEETKEFYRAHGVLHESIHLQTTPQGDVVIVCTDLGPPESTVAELAPEAAPFHAWFKAQVLSLVDIDTSTQRPKCSNLFDWHDGARAKKR